MVVMPCLQSWRRRCRVAFCAEVVIALYKRSGVAVDSEVLVYRSTVRQLLVVVLPVLESVQVVA